MGEENGLETRRGLRAEREKHAEALCAKREKHVEALHAEGETRGDHRARFRVTASAARVTNVDQHTKNADATEDTSSLCEHKTITDS